MTRADTQKVNTHGPDDARVRVGRRVERDDGAPGRLLSRRHIGGVYDILGFMTGESLMTHQLPRAAEHCAPALVAQHPWLDGLEPPATDDIADLMAWLVHQEAVHGERVEVAPAVHGWTHINPIEEACDLIGAEKVVVLPSDETREGS